MPASRKEFLDIQAAIQYGFTLKRVGGMTRTYSQHKMCSERFLYLHQYSSMFFILNKVFSDQMKIAFWGWVIWGSLVAPEWLFEWKTDLIWLYLATTGNFTASKEWEMFDDVAKSFFTVKNSKIRTWSNSAYIVFYYIWWRNTNFDMEKYLSHVVM